MTSEELPTICVSQVARQDKPSAPSVTVLSFGLGDWKVLRMMPWIKYVEESKKFLILDLPSSLPKNKQQVQQAYPWRPRLPLGPALLGRR